MKFVNERADQRPREVSNRAKENYVSSLNESRNWWFVHKKNENIFLISCTMVKFYLKSVSVTRDCLFKTEIIKHISYLGGEPGWELESSGGHITFLQVCGLNNNKKIKINWLVYTTFFISNLKTEGFARVKCLDLSFKECKDTVGYCTCSK